MPPIDLDFKQGIRNCLESTIQPGYLKEITLVHTHNTLHVSSRDTSAPCSPSRLSLGTALVHQDFFTKDTSVCRLICVAVWHPYSTTNEGEVWAFTHLRGGGVQLSLVKTQLTRRPEEKHNYHSWPSSATCVIKMNGCL